MRASSFHTLSWNGEPETWSGTSKSRRRPAKYSPSSCLELSQRLAVAGHERYREAPTQRFELRLEHATVRELEQAHALARRARDHRPERRAQPGRNGDLAAARLPRRLAEVLAEGLTEAALGVVAGVNGGRCHVFSLAQPRETAAEALCTAVGVEAHAVGLLKVAARPLGRHAHLPQLGRAQPLLGLLLDGREERSHPAGRAPVRLERPAAEARPVAGEKGVLHRGKELDVAAQGLLRGARGPAEDARGPHSGDEDAVVGSVLAVERPLHLRWPRGGRCAHGQENSPGGPPEMRRTHRGARRAGGELFPVSLPRPRRWEGAIPRSNRKGRLRSWAVAQVPRRGRFAGTPSLARLVNLRAMVDADVSCGQNEACQSQ